MELPIKGRPKVRVALEVLRCLSRERLKSGKGSHLAYTITRVDPFASLVHHLVQTSSNPNLVSTFAYPNAARLADETVQMVGKSILRHGEPYLGGLVMNSGTHSLHQALHLFLSEYYGRRGWDYLRSGHPDFRTSGIPKPVVLAPLTLRNFVEKATMQSGLGHESVLYYDLDKGFQPDAASIHRVLRTLGERERLLLHVVQAGDQEHGIVHDAGRWARFVNAEESKHGNRPFTLVDATAHWLNTWAREKPGADFSVPEVDAIIVDPQKVELPFNHSLLLLRDYRLLRPHVRGTLKPVESREGPDEEERVKLQAVATTFTSRGAAPVIATYAYLQHKGERGLRKERRRVLENAGYLRRLIAQSKFFRLLPSEGSTIAFEAVGEPVLNRRVAERINQGPFFVTYSPVLKAHTQEQVEAAEGGDERYTGLWGTVMEAHSKRGLRHVFNALEKAASEERRLLERSA